MAYRRGTGTVYQRKIKIDFGTKTVETLFLIILVLNVSYVLH